jgi:hypothetical protein
MLFLIPASMLLLSILVIVVVIGSFYVDYRWRKWVNQRRRDGQ